MMITSVEFECLGPTKVNKSSRYKMEKDPLLNRAPINSNGKDDDDMIYQSSEHEFERSHTSYFSITDRNSEIVSENILQLAVLLEKSAKQLRFHAAKSCDKEGQNENRKRKQLIPPKITENLLPITALWQVICILALSAVDVYDRKIENEKNLSLTYKISVFLMCTFQFVNLILVFSATVKLTKQYLHKTASMRFIINGYFSMIVLFAGLYMLISKIQPTSFTSYQSKKDGKLSELSIVLFIRMLNVSISTATLCGAANVTAKEWYSAFAMSLQMLISFVYFASFLSQVLNPTNIGSRVRKRRQKKPNLSISARHLLSV